MGTANLTTRLGTDKLVRASELLRVSAHPVRLDILDLLGRHTELCVSDMQEILAMEQAVLSQHLALLRTHGIIEHQRQGRFVLYRLARPEFLRIINCLEACCDDL